MAGLTRTTGAFAVTPHKISVCILLQIYAPSAQMSLPFPFSSVSQHNRLGLYLLSLTKSCDDIFEPKLEELINQLREVGEEMDAWLADHLTNRFSSLASPDDLLNFFNDMRGILGSLDSGVVQDDQIILDPNSNLGMFVRRCILAFNLLSFEGVCHLFSSIEDYCKEAHSSSAQFGASNNNLEQYDQMDMENYAMDKATEELELQKNASGSVPFHLHTPEALFKVIEGLRVTRKESSRTSKKITEATPIACASSSSLEDTLVDESLFLRTNLQIQGFLMEQADAIETHGSSSSFSSSSIESFLEQLQNLAPELHRVHFLRYLNKLHSDDYFAALDNLLRYFDYSAGTEGFDLVPPSTGCSMYGRYEIALLCLGMMHFRFGHPNLALEVLTEAVRVSQQLSNDTCLAYTLAAMSNLLSEMGIASTSSVLGSSYSPVTSTASSLSVQQRVYILLKESFRRADSLKLRRLVASNHLAMAKFELMHVQRPLLSFGPKASMRHKTCPVSVCKEIRLGAHLVRDFSSESSTMTIDGSLSSAWLKDLQKSWGPPVISQDSGSRKSSTFFQLCDHLVSIPGSVSQLIGASYLLRATSWELYGSVPMARMNTLVYATLFGDSSSSSDGELAYLKLIQHLALYNGYKDAFAALKIAEEKFLTVSKSKIFLLKLQLLHERALHCGNLKLAQRMCNELGGLASTAMGVDMELKVEASLRAARTLLAAKQYSQALSLRLKSLGEYISKLKDEEKRYHQWVRSMDDTNQSIILEGIKSDWGEQIKSKREWVSKERCKIFTLFDILKGGGSGSGDGGGGGGGGGGENSLNLEVNDYGNLIFIAGDDGRSSENQTPLDDPSKFSDDLSLSSRKKRRLTQTTLLQSSFWSVPKQSEDGLVICAKQQPVLDSETSEFNLVQRSEPSDSIICKVEDGSCSPSSEEILKTVTLDEANGVNKSKP